MAAGDPGSLKRNYSAVAVETQLNASIPASSSGSSTTSVTVASTSGFPSVSGVGNFPYTLIVDPDTTKEEVVTVTAGTGTSLTFLRGQDGTQAVAHAAGAVVRHGVSAREFKELQTHIAARGYDADSSILANVDSHVHGLVSGDGSVVGSTQAVVLTRKTLGTGTSISSTVDNSSGTISGGTITSATVTSSTVRSSTLTNDTLGSDLAAGGYLVTGLGAPVNANDATRKAYVDSILGSAVAAATSATSAATSATSAAASALAASTSATSAQTYANAAATSATSASTSASSASTSASSAQTYANAASTSADSALTSATSAATSASSSLTSANSASSSAASATTSANSASTSASSAATSASSALTSATSAATSASSAATSQSAAATSATSAATSASSASTSASSAATSQSAAATSATSAAASATAAATSASSASASASAAATSATSAATSASSAATTYTNFDQRYLGSKSSAPTVDNQGGTLITGATYWNSTVNLMYTWTGSAWSAISTSYTAPTIGTTLISSGATVSTITGLTLANGLTTSDPTVALGIANKQYVDNVSAGLNAHDSVQAATTAALTGTYLAGSAGADGGTGVGATFTITATGVLTIDTYNTVLNDRVLLKNQATATQNGIYKVTTAGATGVQAVLTRATDYDNSVAGEVYAGDIVFVTNGSTNLNQGWVMNATGTATTPNKGIKIGTDNINWTQFTGTGSLTAGNGITLSSNTVAIDTAVTVDKTTTQTLTNKTLTSPVISNFETYTGSTTGSTNLQASATASGTLTLPAATDTLVGKATTDTLTNKTISSGVLTGTLTAGSSSGTSGQVLSSTGTGVQWIAAPSGLPSQTGNSGKYLTTDGSTASWAAITTDPNPSIFMLMGA